MINVYKRVAKWNSARYEQEYNYLLTQSLLVEEYHEWLQAPDQVNDLKELCDIIFVAMGGIWKLLDNDVQAQQDAEKFTKIILGQAELAPGYIVGALLDQNAITPQNQMDLMHNIIACTASQMALHGLNQEQIIEALNLVCDSNDSKTIIKIASDAKYSRDGKGNFYLPAEPNLRKLMEKAGCLQKLN